MKKNTVIKITKGTLITSVSLFMVLLAWANWQPATYSEANIPLVSYVAFDLSSSPETGNYNMIEQKINSLEGITACSLNSASKLVGVMFVASVTSKETIRQKIAAVLGSRVVEKTFEPSSNGCPVGGLTSFILAIKQTLRFRA
jgi:hypothetical protein